jgi:DNA polymerase-4/DNA polymerase V
MMHNITENFYNEQNEKPVAIRSFPLAIVHIDADAFFASVEQLTHRHLRGKPVVTGAERGIVSSMSYEAKALGIPRGLPIHEIRKQHPQVIVIPSDYEKYSLLSLRMLAIIKRYTSEVEEASIDEYYADITGLRRPLRMTYPQIAKSIKNDLENDLGCTFSIGLAPNKTLAKLASNANKPSGLTIVPGKKIHIFLKDTPIRSICGVGPNTESYLQKKGVYSALSLARKDKCWVDDNLIKPYREIYWELRGFHVKKVEIEKKAQKSISKVKTFTPPSSDPVFLLSQFSKNLEAACKKARRHNIYTKKLFLGLKSQAFSTKYLEIDLTNATADPATLLHIVQENFSKLFNPKTLYRATSVILANLSSQETQPDLFGDASEIQTLTTIFRTVDEIDRKYGKYSVHLASSNTAVHRDKALEKENKRPERTLMLLPGETSRRRISIPYLGQIS